MGQRIKAGFIIKICSVPDGGKRSILGLSLSNFSPSAILPPDKIRPALATGATSGAMTSPRCLGVPVADAMEWYLADADVVTEKLTGSLRANYAHDPLLAVGMARSDPKERIWPFHAVQRESSRLNLSAYGGHSSSVDGLNITL